MERTFTQVGKPYSDGKEEELAGMFERLSWQSIPCTMGAMPGEAIKGAITELRIPKVDFVACSREMAPYGLLGIKGHYKNGDATIYMVDEGDKVVVLASDFFPLPDETKEKGGEADGEKSTG